LHSFLLVVLVTAMELPHTAGCLVCGRRNPHGLKLSLNVDGATGTVTVQFTPRPEHIGFEGIVHGGVLATVLDEAMVWAATWAGKRFCVAGEMSVRFRRTAGVGELLKVEAKVEAARSRLVLTAGTVANAAAETVAEATGKYVPVPSERHRAVVATLVDEPSTSRAAAYLKETSR
jgi:uncharacterized protein (TIGR00369 family)